MNEDLELLRRAIEEPIHQMLLAEVSSPQHALQLAQQIRQWSNASRPIRTLSLDANHDNARELYDSCQQLAANWSEDDEPPALLLLTDASVPDVRIAHPTAQEATSVGFWRSMNLLREGWNDLPCQTIFLITPQQYHLFSTEADHLKRWIPLKLHLIEESDNAPVQSRQERGIIEPNKEELRSKFAGEDDLDDREAANANWASLRHREFLAFERGDKPEVVARRQRLPLFAAAITLEKWEDAKRYDDFLKEVQLPFHDELRRLNLETFFHQRQKNIAMAEKVALSAVTLANRHGDDGDKLMARWTLGGLYEQEKKWDQYENVLQQLLNSRPTEAVFLGDYANFLSDVRGDHDRAEKLYNQIIEIDPKRVNTLSNYAIFLRDVRGDYDRAEEFYKRALESDPKHTNTLGDYANFLNTVRGDYDLAEEFYTRALEIDPKNAITLGNYANFLEGIRGDHDRAEEFYRRAIESHTNYADIFGNYAIFLTKVRGDYDYAEELYKRAIESERKNASILGNYANFLKGIRGDYDRAEEFYKRAIQSNPEDAATLGGYANFLTDVRGNHDDAEEFYKKAIEIDAKLAANFSNYATFLTDVRGDCKRSEELYKRAIEIDPTHNGRYAVHLCLSNKDFAQAEPYFLKALEAAPDDAANIINAAACFLIQGKRTEGRELLDKAATTENLTEPQGVAVDFHRYIHFPRESPAPLKQLKARLKMGDRAEDWSFQENIKRARQDKHPNAPLLSALALVISGEKDIKILNNFPEWTKA